MLRDTSLSIYLIATLFIELQKAAFLRNTPGNENSRQMQ